MILRLYYPKGFTEAALQNDYLASLFNSLVSFSDYIQKNPFCSSVLIPTPIMATLHDDITLKKLIEIREPGQHNDLKDNYKQLKIFDVDKIQSDFCYIEMVNGEFNITDSPKRPLFVEKNYAERQKALQAIDKQDLFNCKRKYGLNIMDEDKDKTISDDGSNS